MYQLRENGVLRLADNASVPNDADNVDWAEYQAWLSAGNTPLPQFTDAELANQALATATATLSTSTSLATAWINTLQSRTDALNDAINGDYALPEEIAELPTLAEPLAAWKKYRVLLGRVSTQPTWPSAPAWPVAPDPYTSETSFVQASPALS